tara:strand:+ start:1159 stop:1416 length:258 start_codon:yes stop_codon:yes gene_type:complete
MSDGVRHLMKPDIPAWGGLDGIEQKKRHMGRSQPVLFSAVLWLRLKDVHRVDVGRSEEINLGWVHVLFLAQGLFVVKHKKVIYGN